MVREKLNYRAFKCFVMLGRVCQKAGLADITPHTLRHTFASLAGDLSFSELTVAALLDHSAKGVTQRYVHIDEALRMTADRVADEMADLLDGGRRQLAPVPLAVIGPSRSWNRTGCECPKFAISFGRRGSRASSEKRINLRTQACVCPKNVSYFRHCDLSA